MDVFEKPQRDPTHMWQARIDRFERRQTNKRDYVSFREITEWYAQYPIDDNGHPDRTHAVYSKLVAAMQKGIFTMAGRSLVRYVGPDTAGFRVTHDFISARGYTEDAKVVVIAYLQYCWIPRAACRRWCETAYPPKEYPPSKDWLLEVDGETARPELLPEHPQLPASGGKRRKVNDDEDHLRKLRLLKIKAKRLYPAWPKTIESKAAVARKMSADGPFKFEITKKIVLGTHERSNRLAAEGRTAAWWAPEAASAKIAQPRIAKRNNG